MKRLLYVVSFTHDLERTRAFYRDGLGLAIGADTPFMVNFLGDGSGLVLLAVPSGQRSEVELCFESEEVAAAVERLKGRGIRFTDELRHLSFGSVIHFRDLEGNLLSLLQPGTAERHGAAQSGAGASGARPAPAEPVGSTPMSARSEAEAAAPSTALAEAGRAADQGPSISTAIVNCRDLAASAAYYRNLLGLRVSVDSPAWVQLDTGDIRLALHSGRDRRTPGLYETQPVSFGLTVPDLGAWIDEARSRRVEFASVPSDEGLGLTAEVVDPEGNVVLIREPISEETLEERLAEAFEQDVPHRAAIRSPLRKAVRHASWVAQRPEYRPEKQAKTRRMGSRARAATRDAEAPSPGTMARAERAKRVASPRGTGPVRTRAKPKNLSDPKRARNRPAVGRLKKAEARTLATAKRAAARASKSRPLKRAASKRGGRRQP